ncbi:hypothetical protein GGH12_000573 [Coemansia sp. RSA 1822]|nr:hypothetical protein GGH12_000573 [Coemansia sp. RSA 1822]
MESGDRRLRIHWSVTSAGWAGEISISQQDANLPLDLAGRRPKSANLSPPQRRTALPDRAGRARDRLEQAMNYTWALLHLSLEQ